MNIRTINYDALFAASPLNATAGAVTSESLDNWTPTYRDERLHWKAPPRPEQPKPADLIDLTGRVIGRLTVLNFHGHSGKSNPVPVWLVRCQCGDYEVRRAKTITRAADPDDCCIECLTVRNLIARGSERNTKARRKAAARLLDRLATFGDRPAPRTLTLKPAEPE